jgi:hypothetical protein
MQPTWIATIRRLSCAHTRVTRGEGHVTPIFFTSQVRVVAATGMITCAGGTSRCSRVLQEAQEALKEASSRSGIRIRIITVDSHSIRWACLHPLGGAGTTGGSIDRSQRVASSGRLTHSIKIMARTICCPQVRKPLWVPP